MAVDEILPPIVLKAVSEFSRKHMLNNWQINENFDGASITLRWTSPSTGKGCNARRRGYSSETKKSPSKRARDYRRHQDYLLRRKGNLQGNEDVEVSSISSPCKHSHPEYLTPPTSPKMERAKMQCVGPSVSVTPPETHEFPATPATTHQLKEESVLPIETPAGQLPPEIAASPDDRAVFDSASASGPAHDKIVQCALDGPMFVVPMSTSDVIRQLQKGVVQAQGVRAWCDGCAEPLTSWTVCSRCADVTYCPDCYPRTDHPKHHSTK